MHLLNRLKVLVFVCIIFSGAGNCAYAKDWQVLSPNKSLQLSLRYQDNVGLQYQLVKNNSLLVVDWSKLGLSISWPEFSETQGRREIRFDDDLIFLARGDEFINDSYAMALGKSISSSYSANESRFLFQHRASGKQLRIDIQLADDGLAFRYALPETSALNHRLDHEQTEFNFGQFKALWAQPFKASETGRVDYQNVFLDGSSDGKTDRQTQEKPDQNVEKKVVYLDVPLAMPALIENEQDIWLFLHESNLTGQYHGSHLTLNDGGQFKIAGPLSTSAQGVGNTYAVTTLPAVLPWRFLLVSDNLADIVESTRVHDLADSSKLSETKWIQPGVASLSRRSDHKRPKSIRELQRFINLSAQMQWDYSLLDAGWRNIGDKALQNLVNYASKRKVGLGVWYSSGGQGSVSASDSALLMNQEERRRSEFERLQNLGVRYIKVDVFDGDKQIMIQQYLDILKDAADHQLMVVFQSSTVPRGWARTYPNLMAMEAVRGNKFYTLETSEKYPQTAVYQNAILPFTRNAVGSMDFAPVSFSKQLQQRLTTYAHEAALGVIFESGIQHLSNTPISYRSANADYQDYLTDLPTSWEQSQFLGGYPGKDIVMARRSGNHWYIAGINAEDNIKQLEFNLDFLSTAYHRDLAKTATLISDGKTANEFSSQSFKLGASRKFRVKVNPAGGFVMIIKLDQDAQITP